jgi:hypothetical protein
MRLRRLYIKNSVALAVAAAALVMLVIYAAVIPTVLANQYVSRLDPRTEGVKADLKRVATGNGTAIFANPDVSLVRRQELIAQTQRNIESAKKSLSDLKDENTLAMLPGSALVQDYHKAAVRQQRTDDVIRQSDQVLNEYADLLRYIAAYTNFQQDLDSKLNTLNKVNDFSKLTGQGGSIAKAGGALRADQQSMNRLSPPPDFEDLQTEAVATLTQAANGYSRLAAGLNHEVDSQTNSALTSLGKVTEKNQESDKQLLVRLGGNSSILQQLSELPEKVEYAQGR